MSKKKALPADVGDFFEGESIFFPPAPQQVKQPVSPQSPPQQVRKTDSAPPVPMVKPAHTQQAKRIAPSTLKTELPRTQESVVISSRETVPPHHHDTTTPSMVEVVRKAVKHIGKEAATYRFTPEEKQHLADIVYTYGRQGYRTSENEITRIAVNWLLWNYQEQGEQSVLARLLKALHE
jgi:hypothetical protein